MNDHDLALARERAGNALDSQSNHATIVDLARRLNQAVNTIEVLKQQLEDNRTTDKRHRWELEQQIHTWRNLLGAFVCGDEKEKEVEMRLYPWWGYDVSVEPLSGSSNFNTKLVAKLRPYC